MPNSSLALWEGNKTTHMVTAAAQEREVNVFSHRWWPLSTAADKGGAKPNPQTFWLSAGFCVQISELFTDNIDLDGWSRWAQQVRLSDECRRQSSALTPGNAAASEPPVYFGSDSLKA